MAVAAPSTRNRSLALGSPRGFYRRISCTFDDAMIAEIRKRAKKNGVTVTEEIRTLIEWGLEAER